MKFITRIKKGWKEEKDFRGFIKLFAVITIGSTMFAVAIQWMHNVGVPGV